MSADDHTVESMSNPIAGSTSDPAVDSGTDLAADSASDPTSAQVEVAAETFRMLASSTRLRLVWTLVNQELDVSSLAEAIGAAVPTVSQHLAKMRLAGLISSRRDGRRIFYTVDDPHVVSMVREIFDHIAPDGSLAPDPPIDRP
ncbi:metalloregulator ArsR/SmtB family transcription factor [Brevibacterium sp. ZH18]|uniref:ArsR/SmtB family transcription factor n=1 Tax=Brevibacterium sp. ZH18 TaxID=2927784 RepID=UPI001F601548|nr:metalloregulator ArsR/SmtB family transcription factor [Brevibacterium sp. ZH18]MCI4012402.1 metalloregulator ArsR/SmtB family transcription factor [Brevibacterium sp. ZH18]